MYSVGVILMELLHERLVTRDHLTDFKKLSGVCNIDVSSSKTDPEEVALTMAKRCLDTSPLRRPRAKEVGEMAHRLKSGSRHSVLEDILRRLEGYAIQLENAVEVRTTQIECERELCDTLLMEILPR